MLFPEESESIDNESDEFGSESGSSGAYNLRSFSLRAEDLVAGVFTSEMFAPTRIESKVG